MHPYIGQYTSSPEYRDEINETSRALRPMQDKQIINALTGEDGIEHHLKELIEHNALANDEVEIEKKIKVSIVDPTKEDVKGATNHFFRLSLSKICTSINCAIKNAVPDPIAIRIEIKSEKLVEK